MEKYLVAKKDKLLYKTLDVSISTTLLDVDATARIILFISDRIFKKVLSENSVRLSRITLPYSPSSMGPPLLFLAPF